MRTHRPMIALLALGALVVAGCETEQVEDDEVVEVPAAEDTAAGVAEETPPPGTYALVESEGAEGEEAPEDVTLEVRETDWSSTAGGEALGSGTYGFEGDTLRVTYETGECAGEEVLYSWEWANDRMTLEKLDLETCETSPARSVFELRTRADAGAEGA